MKARIVIGDTFQDIEVVNFEVSYNKYEDVDLYVLLTPKDEQEIITPANSKTEAVDVLKPSSRGISTEEDIFNTSIPVSNLFESEGKPPTLLLERQRLHVNWCQKGKKLEEFELIEENRVITSDTFKFIASNIIEFTECIKKAIKQLVEREKTFAEDYFLYEIKEPFVIFGDDDSEKTKSFHVYEEVTKVSLLNTGKSVENSAKDN